MISSYQWQTWIARSILGWCSFFLLSASILFCFHLSASPWFRLKKYILLRVALSIAFQTPTFDTLRMNLILTSDTSLTAKKWKVAGRLDRSRVLNFSMRFSIIGLERLTVAYLAFYHFCGWLFLGGWGYSVPRKWKDGCDEIRRDGYSEQEN